MYMYITNGEASVLVESDVKNRLRVYTIGNLTPTNNNNKKKKTEKIDSIVFLRETHILFSQADGVIWARCSVFTLCVNRSWRRGYIIFI